MTQILRGGLMADLTVINALVMLAIMVQ